MSTGAGGGEDRSKCTPCRGTGTVQSSLGGTAHEVTCPWCGGSGQFTAGRDAQAEQGGAEAEAADAQAEDAQPADGQAESADGQDAVGTSSTDD
jgi:DnaJ-class molecular chaperone